MEQFIQDEQVFFEDDFKSLVAVKRLSMIRKVGLHLARPNDRFVRIPAIQLEND